jgi:4-amino-4-deoxy-L-arabinose transferase-like glycosyltransferase
VDGRAVIAFAAILAVALAIRLALALAAPLPRIAGDPPVYDELAVSLASGHGFARMPRRPRAGFRATGVHPPGWPFVLGAVYAATGQTGPLDRGRAARWRIGRVTQAIIGTVAVALIALVAWQLWGVAVALASAALAAVHPPLVVIGVGLFSEPLFVVLELAALAAVLEARRRPGAWRWIVAAGVLAGLATLTRNNGAVLLLPLALGVWTGRPRWSWRALAAPLALAGVALLTVLPWTVRNARALDAFVPVATNAGTTLHGVYNPESARSGYRWRSTRELPPSRRAQLARLSEAERSSALTAEALHYVRGHPDSVPRAIVANTSRLLELDTEARAILAGAAGSRALAHVSIVGFAVFALLAAAGAATRRARSAPRFVWLVPVALLCSVVPFAVNFSRFRAPLEPFLILLAALAVCTAVARPRLAACHATSPSCEGSTSGRTTGSRCPPCARR